MNIDTIDLSLYNLILSSILTGIIIITQIVNYPLLKHVKVGFSSFHKEYVRRIGLVVAPLMLLEIIIVCFMLLENHDSSLTKLLLLLVILIWISTFFIQVPIHKQLSLDDKKNINLLIISNWIRTFCWLCKLIIAFILFI